MVSRDIEQTCVLAVGHRVPVFAAKKRRRNFDGLTAGFTFGNGWWTLAFAFNRPAIISNAGRPGDVIHKREGILEFTIGTVDQIEVAVSVCVRSGFYCFAILGVFKEHQFVVARIVPGIVWRVLVEPLHFTRGGVYRYLARGVQVVVISRVATWRCALPGIPRGRVARTDNDGVGFNVKACTLPRGTAALAPSLNFTRFGIGIVWPARGTWVARRCALLAIQAAVVTFNEWPHPDFFAGFRVAGIELTYYAEFITGRSVNQHDFSGFLIFYQSRGARHGVTRFVITKLHTPGHFTGFFVQGYDARIQGAEENFVAKNGRTTVNNVAAWANSLRQTVGIFPEPLSAFCIQCI